MLQQFVSSKRVYVRSLLAASVLGGLSGCAGMDQATLQQAIQVAGQVYGGTASSALSESDIVAGLREALAQGTESAVLALGKTNGYWSNTAVRIPMPEQLTKVDKALRAAGLGGKVDEFQLTLNRAAEQAAPEAAAVFADAIRAMTLDDARGILSGGNDAATQYFRRVAGEAIEAKFLPIVQQATAKVGVTQQYKSLVSDYTPLLQLAGVQNTDLDAYVTDEAVDGLFYMIAAEEERIRRDPRARTTELLRKVFGSN